MALTWGENNIHFSEITSVDNKEIDGEKKNGKLFSIDKTSFSAAAEREERLDWRSVQSQRGNRRNIATKHLSRQRFKINSNQK